jgi:hypothetical protein
MAACAYFIASGTACPSAGRSCWLSPCSAYWPGVIASTAAVADARNRAMIEMAASMELAGRLLSEPPGDVRMLACDALSGEERAGGDVLACLAEIGGAVEIEA